MTAITCWPRGPFHCWPCLCSPRRTRASPATPLHSPSLPCRPCLCLPRRTRASLATPLHSQSLGAGHTPLALWVVSLLHQVYQGITCHPASQPKLGERAHTACPAGPVSASPGAPGHHLPPCFTAKAWELVTHRCPVGSVSAPPGVPGHHLPPRFTAKVWELVTHRWPCGPCLCPQAHRGITCHPASQPKLGEWALTACPGGLVSAPPGAPGSRAGRCCWAPCRPQTC